MTRIGWQWCARLLVPGLLAWAMTGAAAELQWPGRPFQIIASDKTLPDLLRELAASQGTTALVDPKINGVVSGKFAAAPLSILDSLCTTYALSWYYDGALLYIDPSSDVRSEMISIDASSAGQLIETLQRLRIYDKRYPLLVSVRDGTARVTGPRRYVELVRQAAKLVDRSNALHDTAEIRIFPLRYAWAGDFTITRSGKEIAVPGVANVLRSLYAHGANRSNTSEAVNHGSNSAYGVSVDREIRLASGDIVNAPKVDLPTVSAGDSDLTNLMPSSGLSGTEVPQFQADTRLNAVLVRDFPQRMVQYERLIAAMDERPRLVEIEVTIMDVSTDALDELGIDWRAHNRHGDFQLGHGTSPAVTWNSNTESGQTAIDPTNGASITPVGGVFTATIGNSLGKYLISRISALAQKGDANLIARPKVLTLDNNEAVLENLKEFYISVSGFQDAGLFKVTAGTAVYVTPLIVDEHNANGVMLSINIQDDDLSAQTVSSIPVVDRRTVNTQAMIEEGKSLLIAGYTTEQKTKAVTGVPVLSNVPVLGGLFKHRTKEQSKRERLYLLTPRLVIPGPSTGADGANPEG